MLKLFWLLLGYYCYNVGGPPFEQTLITHTQGLFVCNILIQIFKVHVI